MKMLTGLCRCILALSLTVPQMAFGQCSSSPNLSPTYQVGAGSCGSTAWQVGYTWKGSTTIEYSSYSPAGTCGGNYYDCNCNYVGISDYSGNVTYAVVQTESDGIPGYNVKWTSKQYKPIERDVACSSSSLCCNNATDTAPSTYTDQIAEVFLTC